jgi:tetratricopeptide (TPR) repeat protein
MSCRVPALLIFLALSTAPSLALAERGSRADQARAHSEAGQAAFDDENYEEAIHEFRAAYELVPEPMLLYNIAVAYERMERLDDAVEHYEEYLREEPEADNAAEVNRRLERLNEERVEAQDAPVEVEAVDDQSLEERIPHTALESAHHEVGLSPISLTIALKGIRNVGDVGWPFELEYHYRITPAWHIGAGLLIDIFGKVGADIQYHYGLFLGGRWGFQPIEVLEVRFDFQVGYQYIDFDERAYGYQNAHYIFFRAGPAVAWDIYRGFGLKLGIDARLGYVEFSAAEVPSGFAGSLDILIGAFWAF